MFAERMPPAVEQGSATGGESVGVDNASILFLIDGHAYLSKPKRSKQVKPHIPGTNYRVKDLAAKWGCSANSVINQLKNEPGVLRLMDNAGSGKRRKVVLSIPESVVSRVEQRLSYATLQPLTPRTNPLSVVFLRDRNTGVTKKPRHLLKEKAAQKSANRKRIA